MNIRSYRKSKKYCKNLKNNKTEKYFYIFFLSEKIRDFELMKFGVKKFRG